MFAHEEIIAALLAQERTASGSSAKYLVATNAGAEWQYGEPDAMQRGSYQGKAGSVRRSNKGRTYRAANGTRRYIRDYDSEVIAYVP